MKKFVLISVILAIFATVAIGQVETVADEVLKAYKNRDPELLKKNASGFVKMAISDSYFENEQFEDDLKAVDNWDGKLKEIRYRSENLMGKQVNMAMVHFTDNPDVEDEIFVVTVSNIKKDKWVMLGSGIVSEKKTEFEKGRLSLSGSKKQMEKAEAEKALEKFSIEMANGDTHDKVNEKLIEEMINSLNNDNFFMILNKDKDFLQAAYSDKGYSVEYKEKEKQFECEELLDKKQTVQLFKNYFKGNENWKKDNEWASF